MLVSIFLIRRGTDLKFEWKFYGTIGLNIINLPAVSHATAEWSPMGSQPALGSLVAYGSGKRMVTGTRAGSRIKTKNFKRRFLPHHKSQRRDIWCTISPIASCFNPKFVDRSVPYEAKHRHVKFRRCFGYISSEFR